MRTLMFNLFAPWKRCYHKGVHEKHAWSITRMGETAWFKCPGDDGSPTYAW